MIGQTRVAFEGPEDYNIMLVGEAPGGEEAGQGRPFVGKTGQLLERYLARHNVSRSQVKLANLSKFRPGINPPSNRFEILLNTPQLEEGLNELEEEIKRVKPNVIVALGNWPMWFLTGKCSRERNKPKPGSGILTYRGSRLPALPRWGEDQKIFCTFHPSYVSRNWKWNPVWHMDLGRAIEDGEYPELRYPEYEEYIDPDPDALYDLTSEAIASPWISIDLETAHKKFTCVGWTYLKDGVYKGVCVTHYRDDLTRFSKEMWESDTPKIGQFLTYDAPFIRNFYQWRIGGFYNGKGWDTYVASANIFPDFPRGLDFLTSIYTRFPYYKDEGRVADPLTHWKYNIKDTVGTYQVAMGQMKDIGEIYGTG